MAQCASHPAACLVDEDLLQSKAFVGGAWIDAEDGSTIPVTDPATGDTIGTIPALTADQSRSAVTAAQMAFPTWAALLPQERAKILRRWFDLVCAAKEDLARIMVAEQGKPISEARGEIDYAASFMEFYAEESKRPNIEGVTSHLPGGEVELWREPVGVAALITPWNFPSAMITRKATAALAAGCTVVVHPSKETPFSALALAATARRAGVPDGVFNIVTGDPATVVTPWTEDTRVRALSFTGSTEIGRLLYAKSAATVKRLVLELGGHAPFLVFDDADLDLAVESAISAKFATSGQDCLAANRIFVQRGIYSDFCARFIARVKTLTTGNGFDDPDIGPLMNPNAVAKQEEHVHDALARGANLACGGTVLSEGPLFYAPTVLTDVPSTAKIFREETFGPVAGVSPFDLESEALNRANDSEYGLVAYVHTADPRRIFRLSRGLHYGMVAVNRTKVTGAPIPFGGMKQSGLGREGARQGMEAFTDIKYVCRDYGDLTVME